MLFIQASKQANLHKYAGKTNPHIQRLNMHHTKHITSIIRLS